MTPAEFTAALKAQRMTQRSLIAEVAALTGCEVSRSTVSRMATGESAVNPFLEAYILLRAQRGAPAIIEEKPHGQ